MMTPEDLQRWARAETRLAEVRALLQETTDETLLVEVMRLEGTVHAYALVELLERAATRVRDARWN